MKRAAVLVSMVLSCTAVARQRVAGATPSSGAYQVTGTVVNAVSGEPLAGATVMLSPGMTARPRMPMRRGPRSGFDDTHVARSADDGSFAFDHLAAGKYNLSAFRHGFPQQTFEAHDQYTSAIVVGPDKISTGIRFRMEPDASISGTIVDEHNDPVPNAEVLLFRAGIQSGKQGVLRAGQVMSNDLGHYHFAHLRRGKYYVVVSARPWYAQNNSAYPVMVRGEGGAVANYARSLATSNPALDVAYPLTFYPGATDSAQAEPINIVPGQREDADFTLTATPSLHVRVHVPSSNPQRNVFAMLTQEIFGTAEFNGSSRSINYGQGITDISGVTPGHYILQLRGGGQERGPQMQSEREIDVTGDMEIDETDSSSGVNVTGTVKFIGPAPTDGTRLILRRMGVPTTPLDVNAKGEISSEQPVAPGKCDVFLPMPNYQITSIAVKGAMLDGQTIQVGSDDVQLTIEAAKASASIEGVARKDDEGFAGAMIVLVPEDMSRPTLYRRDESDSDGSFALNAIPPGNYTLLAIENGWDLEWSNPQVMRPYLASGEKVQVAIDGKYHLDAKVQSIPVAVAK